MSAEKASSINNISGLIANARVIPHVDASRQRVHPGSCGHNFQPDLTQCIKGFFPAFFGINPANSIPNAVLSSTVICGIKERTGRPSQSFFCAPHGVRRRYFGNIHTINQHLPAGGFNQALRRRTIVDLPEPDNPMMTNTRLLQWPDWRLLRQAIAQFFQNLFF